jgi:hypothetical protein
MNELSNTPDKDELIRVLGKKDNRFRVAQALFFAILVIGLVVLIIFSLRQQSQNTKLLQEQALSSEQSSQQIKDLQNHIDCVVSLFTEPNRTNLVITDITKCQVTDTSNGQTQRIN